MESVVIELIWIVFNIVLHYMNLNKWARYGHFLLINGLGAVIVLYWAPDGSCDCIVVHVGFWIKLSLYKGDSVRFLLNYGSR